MHLLPRLLLVSNVELARDWSIIFMDVVTATFFALAIVFIVVLGLLSRILLKKSIGVIDENVKPTLTSVKASADSVQGTTQYVSQSAVKPIVRTYGVLAGVRKFASVVSGLTGADTNNGK